MNYLKLNDDNLVGVAALAVQALKDGEIILLPFDTVYGFICDPNNELAIDKIFQIKGRNKEKTLGLAVANLEQANKIALVKNKDFIAKKIPGKFTFILDSKKEDQFSKYCYKKKTIGLRIPDNKLILEITKLFGPVAQTSANKSGRTNCSSIEQIKKQFKSSLELIDLVIDGGKIATSRASEIWDLTGDEPKRIER